LQRGNALDKRQPSSEGTSLNSLRILTQERKMNNASTTPKDNQTQLTQDFKAVVNDAEELLRHAAHDAGQGYHDARAA